jgi:uroporphyrinogen decarboxylase
MAEKMAETLLSAALHRRNTGRPPVWFMRQAGRYHSHYQMLKRSADFIALCKDPRLAAETAMGPVHDFNFDAAILFSDLLFPLEAMGMGLDYVPGPKLDFHLERPADLDRLRGGADLASQLQFQADAVRLTRARLRADKGLIGFVGGPFTLYVYAVAGSHENAAAALPGLTNGLYDGFNAKLLDLLAQAMWQQTSAGAENIALFDTAAGEVDADTYRERLVPVLADLLQRFRALDATTPVTYYSRGTGPAHWDALQSLPFQCLGIDWNHDLAEVLQRYGDRWCIQGNVDPQWLHLPGDELEGRLRDSFARVRALPAERLRGWICGLGHGVLQRTPEANVLRFIAVQREMFG